MQENLKWMQECGFSYWAKIDNGPHTNEWMNEWIYLSGKVLDIRTSFSTADKKFKCQKLIYREHVIPRADQMRGRGRHAADISGCVSVSTQRPSPSHHDTCQVAPGSQLPESTRPHTRVGHVLCATECHDGRRVSEDSQTFRQNMTLP